MSFQELLKTLYRKAISRKLLVWLIATHMTYIGLLDPSHWMTISLLYVGAQAMLDWKDNARIQDNRE